MEEQYGKIEAYLRGDLPESEQQAFEAAMAAEPALAEEVALHRRLQEVLGDEEEWRFRQNLQDIRSGVGATPSEKKSLAQRDGARFLLGLLFLIALSSLLYWWLVPAPVPAPSQETPVDTLPAPSEPEQKTEPEPPLEKEIAPEPAEPQAPAIELPPPFAPNPQLEALADAAPMSDIHSFDLEAEISREAPARLMVEGELLSAQWEGETPFLLELYSNRPADYPGRPLLTGELAVLQQEEDTPIAFAAKKAYFVGFEQEVSLQSRLYYYRVRLQGESAPLFVGKVKLD